MAATASLSASPLLLPGPRSALRAWLCCRTAFAGGSNSRALSCSEAPCQCRAAGASAGQCGGADEGGVIVCSSSSTRRGMSCGPRGVVVCVLLQAALDAFAGGLPPEEKPKLCDDACEKELENVPMVTTESGRFAVQGYQSRHGAKSTHRFPGCGKLHRHGAIRTDIRQKGQPYIFRVGAGQVIKGLDEGVLSMKVGGLRRLYIPGPLAFPKGLTSAPGRLRVAPSSPVVFDVNLLFIPGLDDE